VKSLRLNVGECEMEALPESARSWITKEIPCELFSAARTNSYHNSYHDL
jgi:hypothetical protein